MHMGTKFSCGNPFFQGQYSRIGNDDLLLAIRSHYNSRSLNRNKPVRYLYFSILDDNLTLVSRRRETPCSISLRSCSITIPSPHRNNS